MQKDQTQFELADQWLKTGDTFYRDGLRAELVPFPEYPTNFEYVANMHLNVRPEDPFYRSKFEDAVHAFRGMRAPLSACGEW